MLLSDHNPISMKKFLIFAVLAFLAFPVSAATIPASQLTPGMLIRGSSHNAVYFYAKDGLRYVFPNDKTYFTWYQNFNDVKWVSDADLSTIQIGGNVTYKPGVKMVKINSSPTVYAVAKNGGLRAIQSEDLAKSLYGATWNKQIDDVPDGFFSNYFVGSRIEFGGQYDASIERREATTINTDKGINPFVTVNITDSGYEPSTLTIAPETAVRFVNTGTQKESASEWDGLWGSGTLEPGSHFTRYFHTTEKGRWSFYSKYTSKDLMQGTVIVE